MLNCCDDGKKPYFPMFVDLSRKKVVVVGGGKVAERRVETLLKFAGDITVIAPKVTGQIKKRAEEGKVRWIAGTFPKDRGSLPAGMESGGLKGMDSRPDLKKLICDADMVLAATNDSGCNEQIMRICRERGILVNVSHRKELCDFYFPAVVLKDHMTVGITSGGLSHRQAKEVRKQIETALQEETMLQGETMFQEEAVLQIDAAVQEDMKQKGENDDKEGRCDAICPGETV